MPNFSPDNTGAFGEHRVTIVDDAGTPLSPDSEELGIAAELQTLEDQGLITHDVSPEDDEQVRRIAREVAREVLGQ